MEDAFRILARVTYDVVTPESAEEGDFSENGWVSASESDYPLSEMDSRLKEWKEGRKASLRVIGEGKTAEEAAKEAFRYADENGFDFRDGFRQNGEMDTSGETRSETLHLATEESSAGALEAFHAIHKKKDARARKRLSSDLWKGWPAVSWKTEEAGRLLQIQDFTLYSIATYARLEAGESA